MSSSFVDTNILIRLITGDIPELRDEALMIVEGRDAGELAVVDAVLCELFFVLEKHALYAMSRQDVVAALLDLITAPQFKISSEANIAIEYAKQNPKLDFTDCLLLVMADGKKQRLITFDKDLLK